MAASLLRGEISPTTVLDTTLNSMTVKLRQCCTFGECKEPLHWHYSEVNSCPDW